MWAGSVKQAVALIGIVGLALTVLSTVKEFTQTLDLARYLADHWHTITGSIWERVLGLFGLQASVMSLAFLNYTTFAAAVGMSAIRFERQPRLSYFSFLALNCFILAVTQTTIQVATLHKNDPNLLAPGFDQRFSPSKETKLSKELDYLERMKKLEPEFKKLDEAGLPETERLRRLEELGYDLHWAKSSLIIMLAGVPTFLIILLANQKLLLRRFIQVSVLATVIALLGRAAQYVPAIDAWVKSLPPPSS